MKAEVDETRGDCGQTCGRATEVSHRLVGTQGQTSDPIPRVSR
jgi:hypothetical protein